jgi:glycosyltransferase involved in cell wall biosynthesis
MRSHNLKFLYISSPSFLDMDLSFVKAMSHLSECYYLLDLYPKLRKATALNLKNAPELADVIPMSRYPGMESYGTMLNLDRSYVINRTSDQPLAISNLLLQAKLLQFVLRLNPDVIHFNNQIYFTHFYLFLFRSKLLISIHDPFPHSGEEADTKKLSARLYRKFNVSLIKNHLLYNDLMISSYAEDRGIDVARVSASSLGPYDFFSQIKRPSVEPKCDFLFFGRIQRYKGVDFLLEAFVRLLQHHPDATLTIAGSGKFWFDVSDYAISEKNLRIINRFIPTEELAGLIRNCKVVVCPYRDATQSGVVMTAYAFHKPIIVTNVGALSQVVEEGLTGYIVNASDSADLALSMGKVMRDELSGETAYQKIEEIYHKGNKSWAAIARKTLAIYWKISSSR